MLLLVYRQVTSAKATSTLKVLKNTAKKFGVIGIDEGQFVSYLHTLFKPLDSLGT